MDKNLKKELIEAGKTLIAIFLLRSEKKELFENVDAKIWYRHIRNFIISGKDDKEIEKNIENLTIISFNYDRSLDYYLRTRLQKYYNKIKDRIIYPYGKLAKDNWEEVEDYGDYSTNGKIAPYDKEKIEYFKKLGNNLKVIGEIQQDYQNAVYNFFHDEKPLNKNLKYEDYNSLQTIIHSQNITHEEKQIVKAITHILSAQRLYFLGFAFHKQNLDLLNLDNIKNKSGKKHIYYTNYDESSSLEEVVSDIFPDDKFTLHPSVRKGVYDALIYDFRLG